MAEREALRRELSLELPRPHAGLHARKHRGAVDLGRSPLSAAVSTLTTAACPPRSGSTPPTTLVPPPKGTTASDSSAQSASRSASWPESAG